MVCDRSCARKQKQRSCTRRSSLTISSTPDLHPWEPHEPCEDTRLILALGAHCDPEVHTGLHVRLMQKGKEYPEVGAQERRTREYASGRWRWRCPRPWQRSRAKGPQCPDACCFRAVHWRSLWRLKDLAALRTLILHAIRCTTRTRRLLDGWHTAIFTTYIGADRHRIRETRRRRPQCCGLKRCLRGGRSCFHSCFRSWRGHHEAGGFGGRWDHDKAGRVATPVDVCCTSGKDWSRPSFATTAPMARNPQYVWRTSRRPWCAACPQPPGAKCAGSPLAAAHLFFTCIAARSRSICMATHATRRITAQARHDCATVCACGQACDTRTSDARRAQWWRNDEVLQSRWRCGTQWRGRC